MISREDAIGFLNNKIQSKNIVKHMLATEALMGRLYDFLAQKRETDLSGTREEWIIAGLLHDGDYRPEVPAVRQGIQITEWLKELGYEIPENIVQTMAAHNWENTGVEPKSKMDWALFCGDSLTGLIVATTLVRPDKKLASVTVESVLKKFKTPSFAAGTRREDISLCQEKLGIPLEDFVKVGLESMQKISKSLGL